jgi:ketosteroid isomerase-like protein
VATGALLDTRWAMSLENVERVRVGYEYAMVNREPEYDLLHPEIQWHTRVDLPDSATYSGHEGVAKLVAEWSEAFEDLQFVPERFIDAGDRVVAVLRLRGRMRGSEREVDMTEAHVLTMKDGKATELHEYPTKADALKAAGLEE